MKQAFDIATSTYAVSRLSGYGIEEAMRHWKTRFESPDAFRREVIKHPLLEPLGIYIARHWDDTQPISVQEALMESNLEKRRVMFDCIGVTRLFQKLNPRLLDRQVLQKDQTRWDKDNNPYPYSYEDVYELYVIDREHLFPDRIRDNSMRMEDVYAVRCWCTGNTGSMFPRRRSSQIAGIRIPLLRMLSRRLPGRSGLGSVFPNASTGREISLSSKPPKHPYRLHLTIFPKIST
ncbi:MAG TPA: hypothetical protein VM802_06855 [Chitinophaga sp.]|uniref:hypothetical protein n=1 Tax=Chitinophaga sp. TaxID=1869181 RepID=UPI002D081A15|nr:hypothetical protein [Chitinophaga sp.]HVI44569.1 hypothetical protein [Chitinophaga sp.]